MQGWDSAATQRGREESGCWFSGRLWVWSINKQLESRPVLNRAAHISVYATPSWNNWHYQHTPLYLAKRPDSDFIFLPLRHSDHIND